MTVADLNYWLGKLARLQLLGHGVMPVFVKVDGVEREIAGIAWDEQRDITVIKLK